jgi:hypothetical protein
MVTRNRRCFKRRASPIAIAIVNKPKTCHTVTDREQLIDSQGVEKVKLALPPLINLKFHVLYGASPGLARA